MSVSVFDSFVWPNTSNGRNKTPFSSLFPFTPYAPNPFLFSSLLALWRRVNLLLIPCHTSPDVSRRGSDSQWSTFAHIFPKPKVVDCGESIYGPRPLADHLPFLDPPGRKYPALHSRLSAYRADGRIYIKIILAPKDCMTPRTRASGMLKNHEKFEVDFFSFRPMPSKSHL